MLVPPVNAPGHHPSNPEKQVAVFTAIQAWLGIGSDDGLKLWHNGKLVLDRWRHRISQLDDDVVPLRLSVTATDDGRPVLISS